MPCQTNSKTIFPRSQFLSSGMATGLHVTVGGGFSFTMESIMANESPLKFWIGGDGSLMCSQPLPGCQVLEDPDHIKYYGGIYFLCETASNEFGRLIAKQFNGQFIERYEQDGK